MPDADDPWETTEADAGADAREVAPPAAGGRSRKVLVGCLLAVGTVFGLVLLVLMVIGGLLESGYLPPEEVRTGEDTPERHLERAREIGALVPDECVLLFYSWGLFDAAEGGSALTDQGVAIWVELESAESGYEIDRIPYAAIQAAVLDEKGSLIDDSVIEIETPLQYFYAFVSVEGGGDELFLERLLAEWEERGGHRPYQVPDSYASELDEYFAPVLEDEPRQRELLVSIGVLDEDERVLLHFQWDPEDAAFGGSAVTDRGIAIWDGEADEPSSVTFDRIPYAAIEGFRLEERGSLFDSSPVEVLTGSSAYTAWIPRVHDGDERFLRRAREEWRERGGSRPGEVPAWFRDEERD